MSFARDINYLMSNDSSLSSYCTGGIKYENLPENFDMTKDWVVYSFNKSSQVSCLNSNAAVTNYNVTIKIISQSSLNCETISDYVVKYLNGNDYNGIGDLIFSNDDHSLSLEKGLYMNSLNFNAIYLNI